jgi:hypothetical protein
MLVVVGLVVVLGGLAMTVFNRQFAAMVLPRARQVPLWRQVLATRPYLPNADGRVPMLTVIGVSWVLIGALFVRLALTGQA